MDRTIAAVVEIQPRISEIDGTIKLLRLIIIFKKLELKLRYKNLQD